MAEIGADGGAIETLAYRQNFARIDSIDGDAVRLSFALEQSWPWLSLPPRHPVLIEKYQYFTSVTAGVALGIFGPRDHAALTTYRWQCADRVPAGGYGRHGLCRRTAGSSGLEMDIDIFAADGSKLAMIECAGHTFLDRDFKAWRRESRLRALAQTPDSVREAFDLRRQAGRDAAIFVSPLRKVDGETVADALVRTDGGFHPAHPFHTGSGDHVNVGHYMDCALQMSRQLLGGAATRNCLGGEGAFRRFIELDVPFSMRLLGCSAPRQGRLDVRLQLSQLGWDAATVGLSFAGTGDDRPDPPRPGATR